MTNPVPGPRQPYGPAGGTPTSGSPTPSAPSGAYPPQGSPASYPAPTGVPVSAARAGGPVSYAAPTGEGWSGRALSSSEKNTQEALLALKAEIGKAVVGQDAAVTGLIVGLVAGGHALLEGVPGVAKTLLVRTLARALDVNMARIQFTPDLMPADITGSMIWDAGRSEFVFREGPVFTNLLLADEINRTPPKTQSALLESMEEHTVSIDGATRTLPEPFMVIATQNPVEYEGTYPLPEAQLDRFLLKLELPLPCARPKSTSSPATRLASTPALWRRPGSARSPAPLTSTRPARPPRVWKWLPPSWPTLSTSAGRPARPPLSAWAYPRVVRPPCCAPRACGLSSRAAASSPPTTSRRWLPRPSRTVSGCAPRRTSRALPQST